MSRAAIAVVSTATLLGVLGLALVAGRRSLQRPVGRAAVPEIEIAASIPTTPEGSQQGFLYGRVLTRDGATYEGRLRWGGGEEAFWDDTFNGFKKENPWAGLVPPERLPRVRRPIDFFGIEIAERERAAALDRPILVRFGDLARIEAQGRDLRVTLKSGTVALLDRSDSSDFDDGVRVWDAGHGVVDLDSRRVRSIEFLPTAPSTGAPVRLQGTVRTRQGELTGFVLWDREKSVGSDELTGDTPGGELRLRFDAIRSIAHRAPDGVLVTLRDGREVALSGSREVSHDNRGIAVDDRRRVRALVSWDAFERVDFDAPGAGGSGPAYGNFPPGRPLAGSVTTHDGRRLAGRLVYDLDESESTDTLDAPSEGVDYTIPFGLVAAVVPPGRAGGDARRGRVTLRSGEELQLERGGDLGEGNAGMLVFVAGRECPEYVPWGDVERVDFDGPPAAGE